MNATISLTLALTTGLALTIAITLALALTLSHTLISIGVYNEGKREVLLHALAYTQC